MVDFVVGIDDVRNVIQEWIVYLASRFGFLIDLVDETCMRVGVQDRFLIVVLLFGRWKFGFRLVADESRFVLN